jgi:hypothetical protein
MSDQNACGNRHIDGLALRGRLQSVWAQLEYRYPVIAAHAQDVWIARRNGVLRRLVEREQRYHALLANQAIGPQSELEWDLLALATLEAIGRIDLLPVVASEEAA